MDREVRKIKQNLGLKFAELVYTGAWSLLPSPPQADSTLLWPHAPRCRPCESPKDTGGRGSSEGRGRWLPCLLGVEGNVSAPLPQPRCPASLPPVIRMLSAGPGKHHMSSLGGHAQHAPGARHCGDTAIPGSPS